MKKLLGIAAIAALAGSAHGQVVISEILGSTSGTDTEYIEIANMGNAPVDITGWAVELWDSNDAPGLGGTNAGWGALDGGSPHVVSGTVILNPGDVYTMGTAQVMFVDYTSPYPTSYNGDPFNVDQTIGDNSVENSSYTAILVDAGANPVDSWYILDDPTLDMANRAGAAFVPNFTLGPDGSFLPAGGYRVGNTLGILNFSRPGGSAPTLNNGTLAGGTPGIYQIPAPGALALSGLAGLVGIRRRRA